MASMMSLNEFLCTLVGSIGVLVGTRVGVFRGTVEG